jgi:5-methylthioadenosine/S-adenosylhomocysteine deaminase
MLLICDTTVVTVDAGDRVLYDAAIAIDGGRIADLGPSADLKAKYPGAARIDGRGQAVLPGFANVHTHFDMTIARGVYEDLSPPHKPPFAGGLASLSLPKLNPEERRVMCQLGALEAIRSGTTAVLEDTHDAANHAEAMAATGLRVTMTERVHDRADANIGLPGAFEVDPAIADAAIDRMRRLHADWHGAADGRLSIAVSAWAPDMCSPEVLRRLRELQDELDTIATIHLNQIWGEVEAVRGQRGKLPTEYLAEVGFLSDRLVAAHCRCMTGAEEALLGKAGVHVAFNSAIAARRGLSPRIDELERAGANIAMGSDNMAEDMVEVMRTGLFMERIRRQDGRLPTPEQALRWATANGYRALGIGDGGSLAIGNRADLIVVELRQAHLVPLMRVVSSFVHQGQPRDITAVMVDGRWLMRDGEVLTMDEAGIVAEADRIGRAAWARLLADRPELTPPPGFDTRTPS